MHDYVKIKFKYFIIFPIFQGQEYLPQRLSLKRYDLDATSAYKRAATKVCI